MLRFIAITGNWLKVMDDNLILRKFYLTSVLCICSQEYSVTTLSAHLP